MKSYDYFDYKIAESYDQNKRRAFLKTKIHSDTWVMFDFEEKWESR